MTETITEPLLTSRNDDALPQSLIAMKRSCVIFGFLFGTFIQFSTLGANWVIILILGRDSFASATHLQLFTCSLIWSAMTSIITICLLKLLRDVMRVVVTAAQLDMNNKDSITVSQLDPLMSFVEGRFVGSAFVGVCCAWAITDYMLGLRVHFLYSIVALFFASVSGCCMFRGNVSVTEDESDLQSAQSKV
jgi:hypothetical protein